jgi:hypothetical protein
MLRRESQLVDKVAYVCVVEVHELVHVGQVEGAAWGRGLWCWEGAAVDALESRRPVGEEPPVQESEIILSI